MANIQRNFVAGRMNKSLDERLIPNGEYIDALNVRLGSTEESEIGAVENAKGNVQVTTLQYIDGTALSSSARCIGVFEDGANETIYWFVHDPAFTVGATGKLDLIVSYNVITGSLIYHVVSINSGDNTNTTLNFNSNFLITSVSKIDNLIFFTDNLNAPRVINTDFNYSVPFNNIDQFSDEELLVIKKPPLAAPTLNLLSTTLEDSFLEDNFICFAYRYKYSNGEYSAVSQFSEPSFQPSFFEFSPNSFLNEGMVNSKNAVQITYNTGSSLVVGIDLLFKEANDPTIKIIEKIKKSSLGPHNTNATYVFTNSKIFTLLPESEILRLYDNVPRLAKAQTLMGNRLIYGNYTEGYNLIDINNQPLNLQYTVALETQDASGVELNSSNLLTSNYTAFGNTLNVTTSGFTFDLGGYESKLIQGASLNLSFTYQHLSYNGADTPTQLQGETLINFQYVLVENYTTVSALYNSSDFQSKLGLVSSAIQTVADAQNGLGATLTDAFNFSLTPTLSGGGVSYSLNQTGLTSSTASVPPSTNKGEPIDSFLNGTEIQLFFPVAQYIQTSPGTTNLIVSYNTFTSITATLQATADLQSLHSNRGYELGIVYMDEYNRASIALVSNNNTVNIPCRNSQSLNKIIATIPTTQRAPSWATRYKFCLKPDRTTYETIYSSIFINDPNSNNTFLLLEGDNIAKVEQGDRLIVKRDVNGPVESCVFATVLEKQTQVADFITPASGNPVPGGTYMKMKSQDFSTEESATDIISLGTFQQKADNPNENPVAANPFYTTDGGTSTNYNVPSGSRIVMKIKQRRPGGGGKCEERESVIEEQFIAQDTYTDMYQWFINSNATFVIENNATTFTGNPDDPVGNIVIPGLVPGSPTGTPESNGYAGKNLSNATMITIFGGDTNSPEDGGDLLLNNYYRFYENNTNNTYSLLVSGTEACNGAADGSRYRSRVEITFTVFRRDSVVIFETEPAEALPDVWFENEESFSIDSNGNHSGNITNQDISTGVAGVVDTKFFNCFAFGNGVESYKIRDALNGKSFNLGNRVFSTSNVEYKEALRFADLTYSGVYNDETNVNKLNEFNLGLANFKPLEESYGDVEILYARRTDILVLQEDKISYVLASKNIISDSTGGGLVASVPEILGNQIARIENYGISNNSLLWFPR